MPSGKSMSHHVLLMMEQVLILRSWNRNLNFPLYEHSDVPLMYIYMRQHESISWIRVHENTCSSVSLPRDMDGVLTEHWAGEHRVAAVRPCAGSLVTAAADCWLLAAAGKLPAFWLLAAAAAAGWLSGWLAG